MASLGEHIMPVDQFVREVKEPTVISGTAFFLSPDPHGIPFVLRHQWMRSHIIHDTIVLLTIMHASQPFVHPENRLEIEQIAPRLVRVKAWYGFMQEPRINDILHHLRKRRPDVDFEHPTYYLASPKIRDARGPGALPNWQRNLFRWMTRNARPLTDSLGLPPNNVIEFGVEVAV
jgi:KUP system potassium uptake protein